MLIHRNSGDSIIIHRCTIRELFSGVYIYSSLFSVIRVGVCRACFENGLIRCKDNIKKKKK